MKNILLYIGLTIILIYFIGIYMLQPHFPPFWFVLYVIGIVCIYFWAKVS